MNGWDLLASLGTWLLMVGTMMQMQMQLEETWAYRRRVQQLDPEGAKEAQLDSWGERYKYPTKLVWVPPERHLEMQSLDSESRAWSVLFFGSAFAFCATLSPLSKFGWAASLWSIAIGIVALFIACVLVMAFVKDKTAVGTSRADQDYDAYHRTLDEERNEPSDRRPADDKSRGFWAFIWSSGKTVIRAFLSAGRGHHAAHGPEDPLQQDVESQPPKGAH